VGASVLCLGYQQMATAANDASVKTPVSRVAPVFQHGLELAAFRGDGPGPVMLTEDEARKVINDELTRALQEQATRVSITPDGLTLHKLPVTVPEGHQPSTQESVLVLDGWIADKKIGYECVSNEDEHAWGTGNTDLQYLPAYQPRVSAEHLRAVLAAAKPEGTFGVFYNPEIEQQIVYENSGDIEPNWRTIEADAKMLARFTLREQVRDFVKWLKAEGVI
jgi:hypothetical protein